jgi:4-amino-4-deoxy-L-arabinose transferase-like glycosyltransferase
MTAGIMLHYLAFDYLWWVLAATGMVYLLKTDDARWWLGVGVGIGLGMLTKYTMAFFAAGIVGAVVLTRARRYLLNRWLWAGAALSLLIFAPNLIWQIQHNFVSLDFLNAIRQRDLLWGRASNFLIEQLYNSVNPFTLPLLAAGFYFCVFSGGKRFRPLVWMFVIPFALFDLMKGRSYYIAPAYPMLLAAGAVWGEAWLGRRSIPIRRWVGGITAFALVASTLLIALLTLPVMPVKSPLWNTANNMSDNFREMIGWPELVDSVAQVVRQLPASERDTAAILTTNYGETGALTLYGDAYDFPPVISPVDSAWYRGYGAVEPQTVIVVGTPNDAASRLFRLCSTAAHIRNAEGIQNEESLHSVIQICREMRRSWPEAWNDLLTFQ